MNERPHDFELLREFVQRGNQEAFADLVRRHLDLVYGTALHRVLEAEPAREVAQDVFAVLACKAWRFGPDDSMAAWLHRTALLEAKQWLRGELRRRRREQTAAELGTTMKTPDEEPALRSLVPLLDDALLSLREKERTVLLLRFYENRSLREVGLSLGVSEDLAQKRVSGALERLSRFFQRRGFRTATTAATTAALQRAAASVSTVTTNAVVNSILQSVPPGATGALTLAVRLMGLTKAQLAALCLVIMAVPTTWQWEQAKLAGYKAALVQTDLDRTREERMSLETEIRRLSGTAEGLNASLAEASKLEAQKAQAKRQLEAWKARIRATLLASDYHWPEDSPFVRVPKATVPKLGVDMPVAPPGIVAPEARELLGLSPQERQAMEERLQRYFADLDGMIESGIQVTNHPVRTRPPASAIASETLYVPALGEAAQTMGEQLAADLEALLGEQRWPVVESQWNLHGTHTLRRILELEAAQQAEEISVWVVPNDQGVLTVGYQWASLSSAFSTDGATLASVLAGASSENSRSAITAVQRNYLPGAITSRILAWLQEQAATRLAK